MRYSNIEIGTANFGTLIENKNIEGNGLSIEPNKELQDLLKDREGWTKINSAIGYDGVAKLYRVPLNKIPPDKKWMGGCSSINEPHANKEVIGLQEPIDVACISVSTLIKDYDIESVGYLKIDCESYDSTILLQFIKSGIPIDKIQIESGWYNSWGKVDNQRVIDYAECLKALDGMKCEVIKGDTLWTRNVR